MKARPLLLLFLLVPTGCSYRDTFALNPGQRLLLTGSRIRHITWRSDYPITVTEGRCVSAATALGSLDCPTIAPVVIQDHRSGLFDSRANFVRIEYPRFADF